MSASSVTGSGVGASRKPTSNELAILANGPNIIFTGLIEATDGIASPPITLASVVFNYPLPGGADNYVVLLTTINAGYAYVADRDEDGEGNFTGFSVIAEEDGTVMYLVAKVGQRPNL